MKRSHKKQLTTWVLISIIGTFLNAVNAQNDSAKVIKWQHLSSLYRHLPFAEAGAQVSTLIMDIVGDGHWFKHIKGQKFEVKPIDPEYFGSRSGVADIIEDGYPEVVLSSGDHTNSLNFFEYDGKNWDNWYRHANKYNKRGFGYR